MVTANICLSIPVLLGLLHSCISIGIRRVGYESKYGRVIHRETAACGSLHEVGPGEKYYFDSKLIRSPFDPSSRKDIHYLDVSKNKLADSVSVISDNPPNNEDSSSPATDNPEGEGRVSNDSPATPASSNSRPPKLRSRTAASPSDYKRISLQKENSKNSQRKSGRDQKWYSELSPQVASGGVKYNSLGQEVEAATTAAPPVSTRKPHWSDRYYGKSIKESALYELGKDRGQLSSSLTRERRGFFTGRAHQPSIGKKISKRSIFSYTKENTELEKGRHEACIWRFTAKSTCKHLTARLTRFKENEMLCTKEYLLFKSHFDQMRFCNEKKFLGSFHAKGKTLIVEHKKVLGGPESHFEGYVTCLDK